MQITITVQRDPEGDCLLPYLAIASERSIQARGSTRAQAIAEVQGIALHWIAEFKTPPTLIRFRIQSTPPGVQEESPQP